MTKFVFITGVSTGIGRSLFERFHHEGYHVIGTVRNENDASMLKKSFPDHATLLQFDVRDIVKMEKCISQISHLLREGRLCCLINNAGYAVPGPLELLSEEDFEQQLDVNLKSVRRITNALLPFLKGDQPGRIINISSVSGILNTPFLGAYCVSKHALESMTEIYRRELHLFGIKVISILPGPVKTEIWRKNLGVLNPYMHSPYAHILKNADKLIEASDKSGLPASHVSNKVWQAFTAKNPATRYIVHKKPWSIWMITRLIPSKMLDNLMAKTMSKGDKIRPV
jgi:NAD(P)-dependent dehydrogenase (short-subunit alcohol dehydrogenase family)